VKHAPLLSLCPGNCCGLRETGGTQGGCVRRVLEKVPADLILDPVIWSGSQDRVTCKREESDAEDNADRGRTEDWTMDSVGVFER
jgi:hypothetical protein